MAQTKAGQNLRWYFQGQAVGMGRMTSLKPDTARGLDPVKEAGNDDIVEYVPKITETTVTLGYNVINRKQLALAMGQSLSGYGPFVGTGNVPEIPDNLDCVERRLKAGTANTGSYGAFARWISTEVVEGYTLYQLSQWEKDAYDSEVDKIVARNLSVKCKRPVNFEGINGIQFDSFTGNGKITAFALSQAATVPMSTGQRSIRAESPLQFYLKEGIDYTIVKAQNDTNSPDTGSTIVPLTSSGIVAPGLVQQASTTATINFTVAPASSTVPNVLVVYAW